MISSAIVRWFIMAWSFIGIVCVLITPLLYLLSNGFVEQGEVTFSTVSWLVAHGHLLYTDLEFAERYSLQHGPIVYLVLGGIMKALGPSYLTAKLGTVAAFLLGIAFSWALFRKHLTKTDSFYLLGLESWLLLHWPYSYLIRSDALMFLCVVVGLYFASTAKKRLVLILGIALPLGFILNLKIHGGFYFLPILYLVYQHLGLKAIFVIFGLSLLIGIIPFFLPQISLANYLLWLTGSLHHSFLWKKFVAKTLLVMELCFIPIVVGTRCGLNLRSLYLSHKYLILTLFISIIIPSIIGSKIGSGTNHLIPFIPIIMYIFMLFFIHAKERREFLPEVARTKLVVNLSAVLIVVIGLSVTVGGINGEKRMLKHISASGRAEIIQDFRTIETKFAGKSISIGHGERSDAIYRDIVPLPVFHGNPYLVDTVALGDMKNSGLAIPPATLNKLKEGKITVWLIPTGHKPFSSELFGGPFREAFFENYKLEEKTKYFDVWVHIDTSKTQHPLF